MSEIINSVLREALAEDAEDFEVFAKRANEPLISYEQNNPNHLFKQTEDVLN